MGRLDFSGEWLLRARKKSTCQSIIDYAQRSFGNIWWVCINYEQETFSFPFFRDLQLSIILIVFVMFQYSN
ncbi:hypothetical protein C0J52_08299 [Blattella germanica]|nr:hypothetical protein C0J52_08299 [Blattella germanica]